MPFIPTAYATSSVPIPAGLGGDIASSAGEQLSGLSGILTLIVGVLLAGVLVKLIIGAFHKH